MGVNEKNKKAEEWPGEFFEFPFLKESLDLATEKSQIKKNYGADREF